MIRKNVKNYLGIFALVAFVISGMIGGISVVKAASDDITFGAETTLIVGGQTLYVLNGGTAASYSIGASSVSFYMEDGSSITVRSLGKKVMDTTPSGAYSCSATFSTASLTSTATETFTITPSDTTCSVPAGGGAGSVSGGGTTVTPVVETPAVSPATTTSTSPVSTPESTVTPAPVAAAPQVSTPSIQITAGTPFIKRLTVGLRSSDVRQLQEMLLNDGVYPEGLITGYFGQLTKKAVQQFQEKYGIAKQGNPGYGDVGPNTRAKLNQILEGTSATPTSSVQGVEQNAMRAQIEVQITTLQEQLVLLLAELARQLQAQIPTGQ